MRILKTLLNCTLHLSLNFFFALTFASTKKCSISWCFTHWVDTGLDSTGLSDAEPKTQSKIQVRTQSLICLDMDYVIHASHPHDVSSIPVQKLVFPVHHVLCSDCTIWSHGGRQPVSAELLYAGFSLHKVVCSESTLHVGPRVYQPRSEPSSRAGSASPPGSGRLPAALLAFKKKAG